MDIEVVDETSAEAAKTARAAVDPQAEWKIANERFVDHDLDMSTTDPVRMYLKEIGRVAC